jgi:apolipoprotein N-acyltransferase
MCYACCNLTLLEFIRGAIAFTGFPWLLLSHSQYPFTIFVQILDVIGAYGLSGLLIAINALILKGVRGRRSSLVFAVALFVGACLYGSFRVTTIPIKKVQRVALVQASVPQEMKDALDGKTYDPAGSLSRYLKATDAIPKSEEVDLLVWPETVVLSVHTER